MMVQTGCPRVLRTGSEAGADWPKAVCLKPFDSPAHRVFMHTEAPPRFSEAESAGLFVPLRISAGCSVTKI
jgi:hypothetical protein